MGRERIREGARAKRGDRRGTREVERGDGEGGRTVGARVALGAEPIETLLEVEAHEIGGLVGTGEIVSERSADGADRITRGRAGRHRALGILGTEIGFGQERGRTRADERLREGQARIARAALVFEGHEQRIGRTAIRLRERDAEAFTIGTDERRGGGAEALIRVTVRAVVVAQRKFVRAIEMTEAGPGGADDLTVERAREEVIPAEIDRVRVARELQRQIGAADHLGRSSQHRTDGPTRQVVHEQDITLEHISAQRL